MSTYEMESTVLSSVGAGSHPTLTMNSDYTIVAGWSSTESSNLSYRVGTYSPSFDPPTIIWGEPVVYDGGDQATLAINDSGYVASVHRSSTDSNNLFYRLGKVDRDTQLIEWGDSIQFNAGTDAFVAINENVAVVVWSSTNSTNLYYSFGTLDKNNLRINWNSGEKYDAGLHPTVSINNSNRLVLGHASSNSTNLYYQLGYVTSDFTQLKLGAVTKYDDGDSNDLTVDDNNNIWESHKSSNDSTAFYKIGTIDTIINTIDWDSLEYRNDHTDSIRLSGPFPYTAQVSFGVSIRQIDTDIDVVVQTISKVA